VLPESGGILEFHEDPYGIPIDGVAPGIIPADVKLHLNGLIGRIVSYYGHILNQQVIRPDRLTGEQQQEDQPFTFIHSHCIKDEPCVLSAIFNEIKDFKDTPSHLNRIHNDI
jgi:hypothetical protein